MNFNAATVAPAQAMEPVPSNWYNVIVDESEMKVTNDGEGAYLQLRLSIMDGSYANHKLWVRLNIQNNSEKAVEIAYQQLSAICHAVGVIQLVDSTELHNKPFQVKVVLKPPSVNQQTGQTYEASNDCKGFKAIENGGGAPDAVANTGGNAGANTAPAWAGKTEEPANNQQAAATTQPENKPAEQQPANVQPANVQPENQPWNQQQPPAQQQQPAQQQPAQQQDANVVSTQHNSSIANVEKTPDQSTVASTDGNDTPPWMQ